MLVTRKTVQNKLRIWLKDYKLLDWIVKSVVKTWAKLRILAYFFFGGRVPKKYQRHHSAA